MLMMRSRVEGQNTGGRERQARDSRLAKAGDLQEFPVQVKPENELQPFLPKGRAGLRSPHASKPTHGRSRRGFRFPREEKVERLGPRLGGTSILGK